MNRLPSPAVKRSSPYLRRGWSVMRIFPEGAGHVTRPAASSQLGVLCRRWRCRMSRSPGEKAPRSVQPAQRSFRLFSDVVIGVCERFREGASGSGIAYLSQRLGRLLPHVVVAVLECGDQRLHDPVVVNPSERLGGILARPGILPGLQNFDQCVNVTMPARQRDVESFETV